MDLSHIISGEEATVSQICMIVPDVDKAVEAHLAVSEAGPFSVWEYPEGFFQRLLYYGKPSPFTLRVALNAQQPQIEYVQPLQGPSIFHDHIEEIGYGLHHVAYRVADIGPIRERMEAAGFEAAQETAGWGLEDDGLAIHFDTRATFGCWTEITEPARHRRPADQMRSAEGANETGDVPPS
jgi:catechol 2,3-dioxygenase-like lactoylglutathione lyase family enzyme